MEQEVVEMPAQVFGCGRSPSGPKGGGAMLLLVLLLSGTVILLGIGRLLAFHYQVRMRLDRQREIQQELATRSALRWLESVKKMGALPVETNRFGYATERGDIGVSVCPAPFLFPKAGDVGHYDSSDKNRESRRKAENYAYVRLDGAKPDSWNSILLDAEGSSKEYFTYGLVLGDRSSTTNTRNRVEIDLSTDLVDALWTLDPYGRRYFAEFSDVCKSIADSEGDVVRFALTPLGKSFRREGGGSDYAIWMEQTSPAHWTSESGENHCPVALYFRDNGTVRKAGEWSAVADNSKGIQLSGAYATVIDRTRIFNDDHAYQLQSTHTYDSCDMGEDFAKAFSEACVAVGGIRMTLEVEIRRPRPESEADEGLYFDRFTRLSVTPAYEYTTVLDWKEAGGGKATVYREQSTAIRLDIGYRPETKNKPAAITYDTHGTARSRKRQKR